MTRQADYDSFVSANPTPDQLRARVRTERDNVDKRLTWARLKAISTDYNFYTVLKSFQGSGGLGNLVLDDDTKLRVGWVRWQEIRKKIDTVDSWLSAPDASKSLAILRLAMVEIPDSIDFEMSYLDRNVALIKTKAVTAVTNALDTASGAVAAIAIPVALVYAASAVNEWSKKRR